MKRHLFVFAALAALAACGGGGHSGVTPPTGGGTPTPTASPSSSPTAAPTPADCPSFTPAAGGVPLQITDDSGLTNAQLIVYVQNGTNWLSNDGSFDAGVPNPLPAACFKTTTGSSGTKQLIIPPGVGGGRIYFAYAPTPSPGSSTVPNPFSGQSVGGPNPGYTPNPFPWDFIEYGTKAQPSVIDTSQVDAMQLPLELSVGATPLPVTTAGPMPTTPPAGVTPAPCPTNGPSSQIVGVTSCNFANIFLAMEQISPYNQLVVTQPFLGTTYDLQVVAPSFAGQTSFPWDIFSSSVPSPTPASCPAPATYGYLSCILTFYKNNPQVFTSKVSGADGAGSGPDSVTGDNYCLTSDGTANFEATDVGPSGTCASSPNPTGTPYPFHINITNFMSGVPPANDNGGATNCKTNLLFQQPWGLANVNGTKEAIAAAPAFSATGHLFAFEDSFALWKALTSDILYGAATQSGTHPIAPSGPGAIFTTLFQGPMYDQYDYVMHEYFDSNMSYGLSYDDAYNLESFVDWYSGDPIDVRINRIPTASVTLPQQPITPQGAPNPCPTLTPSASAPIGTF